VPFVNRRRLFFSKLLIFELAILHKVLREIQKINSPYLQIEKDVV
jgi:hypothetical protein